MKFLLRTVIIFITYECFRYGQSFDSDSDSDDSGIEFIDVIDMREPTSLGSGKLIEHGVDNVLRIEENNMLRIEDSPFLPHFVHETTEVDLPPRLIHETTVAALTIMSSLKGNELEKQFKKTGMCAHYTALVFIEKLYTLMYSADPTNESLKNVLEIYNEEHTYLLSKSLKETYINHPNFSDDFHKLHKVVMKVTELLQNFENLKKLSVLEYFNELILDSVLTCEVPVSNFMEYASIEVNDVLDSFRSSNEGSTASSSNNMDSIQFNAIHIFRHVDVKGSMSCYMNRLLILLAYLNKEATNVSWNEANINESLKEIYDYKWLTTNQTRNLLMSTHKEYSTKWKELHKHVMNVIDFLFHNININVHDTEKIQQMENVIEFYDHSLLECKVPMKHFFMRNEENKQNIRYLLRKNFHRMFRYFTKNYEFFDNYYQYTIGCFKQSIFNMFKELTKLNHNCEAQMNTFIDAINIKYRKNTKILNMNSKNEEFSINVLKLDKIGVETWKRFEECLYTGVRDDSSYRLAVINILSRFQSFYKSCGASPKMMSVYWNELISNESE